MAQDPVDRSYEDEVVRLLTSLQHMMEIWKLTLCYIAVLLTVWLILRIVG